MRDHPVEKAIQAALKQYRTLVPESRVVAAVSGGRDSMVLLHAAQALLGAQLEVAHFNHQLRREATADADWLAKYCQDRRLRFHLGSGQGKDTSEAFLRQERYAFLQGLGASTVLLGHHLQDQLETFFMRLLRGTGIWGLGAMVPNRPPFLRPFLTLTPRMLEDYRRILEIPYRPDSSNESRQYLRNRIRQSVIPGFLAESELFGGSEAFYPRFAAVLEDLRSVRSEMACLEKLPSFRTTPFWDCFQVQELLALAPSRRREMFHCWIPALSRRNVEALLEGIAQKKGRVVTGATRLSISQDWVFVQSPDQRATRNKGQIFHHQGDVVLCSELGFEAKVGVPYGEVRCLQPGDRWKGKRLKRYWERTHIPHPERTLLPVLAKKGEPELLWIYPNPSPDITILTMSFPFSFHGTDRTLYSESVK